MRAFCDKLKDTHPEVIAECSQAIVEGLAAFLSHAEEATLLLILECFVSIAQVCHGRASPGKLGRLWAFY